MAEGGDRGYDGRANRRHDAPRRVAAWHDVDESHVEESDEERQEMEHVLNPS